ncbi:DUF1858 domain-containing protein [Lactobacillus sp. CC-MHH1034]|uniref:DUF1858 domain-containing protein n=1 Tax=Agrilactobacillus fermenti TaxID=2586909 RepID=UPI001E3A6011|nr:DUF1858 domain-containing protein [Agrilactobacillus fermenti]MCD2255930.1 DUF1858 domain-containing protein [Agrilactobacillus fermenti]
MTKILDLNQSVYDLVKAYPEVIDVLYNIGLKDIKKPGMLNTAGRFMTIPKGAALKKVPLAEIITKLQDQGFEVINHANN